MMQMKNYAFMFEENPDIGQSNARPADTHFVMSTTHDNPPGTLPLMFETSRRLTYTLLFLQCMIIHQVHSPLMFEENPDIGQSSSRPADTHFVMSTTHDNPPGTLPSHV